MSKNLTVQEKDLSYGYNLQYDEELHKVRHLFKIYVTCYTVEFYDWVDCDILDVHVVW